MVDVNMKVSPRKQRQNERMERVRAYKPKGVRVVPANDELRRVLKHPNGMGFRPEGSVEWPNDRFTKRRLADGSVRLEEPGDKPKHHEPKKPNSSAA